MTGVLAIKDVYPQLLKYMKQVDEDPENISISGKIGISWGHNEGKQEACLRKATLQQTELRM